jgi:nucleoside-diphosphate-sugar epimerase
MEQGMDLFLMNRGRSPRPVTVGAHQLVADINDEEQARQVLNNRMFDVVVDWVAYTPAQVERDMRLFAEHTAQYIFISSASAYKKPPLRLPVTENMPLENPYWLYSQLKADCEQLLLKAYDEQGFPVTIVRPSHTYDRTTVPLKGNFTVIRRLRQGKKIIIHGDGNSRWTLTHHRDFARGFVPLLGNPASIGQAFHITSDEVLTWNRIIGILADAAGFKADIFYLAPDKFMKYDADWGGSVRGDKMYDMVFDNSKIKSIAPEFKAEISFEQGAREILDWFIADTQRQIVDERFDALMDRMIEENGQNKMCMKKR